MAWKRHKRQRKNRLAQFPVCSSFQIKGQGWREWKMQGFSVLRLEGAASLVLGISVVASLWWFFPLRSRRCHRGCLCMTRCFDMDLRGWLTSIKMEQVPWKQEARAKGYTENEKRGPERDDCDAVWCSFSERLKNGKSMCFTNTGIEYSTRKERESKVHNWGNRATCWSTQVCKSGLLHGCWTEVKHTSVPWLVRVSIASSKRDGEKEYTEGKRATDTFETSDCKEHKKETTKSTKNAQSVYIDIELASVCVPSSLVKCKRGKVRHGLKEQRTQGEWNTIHLNSPLPPRGGSSSRTVLMYLYFYFGTRCR